MNSTPDALIEPGAADHRRRRLLYGAAGAAALAAGAGLAAWRMRDQPGGELPGQFWGLQFDSPAGGNVALAAFRGKPLLLNFWATWCPPCVEEFPLLDGFFRQNAAKGWQVLGLAIDQPSAVRGFLKKAPVSFPIGLAGLEGSQLTRDLGNLTGGLPFTVLIGMDGRVLQRRMGRVADADLQQWAALR